MKRSPLALVSLIAGLLLALLVATFVIIDGLGLGEDHPFVIVSFLLSVPILFLEAPVMMWNLPINFPVVLPILGVVPGIASLARKEPLRRLAIAGIALTVLSIVSLLLL